MRLDYKTLFRLGMPLSLQYLGDSIVIIVEAWLLSEISIKLLNAVVTGFYVMMLLYTPLLVALNTTYTTLTAQLYGLGKVEQIPNLFRQCVTVSMTVALVVSTVAVCIGKELFYLIYPEPETAELGYLYVLTFVSSIPGVFLFGLYVAFLYGIGKTRESMYAWLLSDFLNLVFDIVFIRLLNLHVIGAALAFTLSIYLVLPLQHYYLRKYVSIKCGFARPSRTLVEGLKHVGIATGIERLVATGLYVMYNAIIGRLGEVVYAAHQLGTRIESFIYSPLLSLRDLANIVIGQLTGQRAIDGIVNAYRKLVILGVLYVLMFATPILTLVFTMPNLLIPDPRLVPLVHIYLVLAILSDFGLAVVFLSTGAYQAIARAAVASSINLILMFGLRIVPSYIMLSLGLGIVYIWSLMIIDTSVRGIVLGVLFTRLFGKRPIILAR